MNEIKLSIITINLDNEAGLDKTIKSVIAQKYFNFEYIVIDGCSRDGSVKIIQSNEDRIDFWVSEIDNGIYCAMNKGIKKATGEYCLFLNSGDYLNNCDVLSNVFNSPVIEDMIIGSVILEGKNKREVFEIPDIDKLTFHYFLNSTFPHPGVFIKRNLFSKVGYFNEGHIISSDLEFFLVAIFKYASTLKKIPEIISVFDWNGLSSIPENASLVKKERTEILQKHFQRFLPDYKYIEQLELANRDLEFRLRNSFWFLVTKFIKRIKNKLSQ